MDLRAGLGPTQVVPVDQAIAYYTDYIRDHPDDPYGYSMRGTIWLDEKKDLDAALKDYTEAIRLASDRSSRFRLTAAMSGPLARNTTRRLPTTTRPSGLQPEEAIAYSGRGLAWHDKTEFDKAIADLSEAIRLDPKLVIAYNGRGLAWMRKGDFDKAIADYSEAIRLDPQNTRAYEYRGLALYAKGDYEKSITDFDVAIGLDSRDFVAYIGRGCAWYSKNDYTKAIADFDLAIRLDPQHVKAYVYRASAWYRKTEYDQAIRDYAEAIRLDPRYGKAYADRASVWYARKEYDKAIADDSEAIRLDPTLAGVFVERGDARRDKGEWANAAADYAEAIRRESSLADAYDGRAWIWAACPDAKHRDGKRAVESATKSCELTGWKVPNNLDTLAAAYAESGDFLSAVKWQAKAVALATDEDDKAAYSSRLMLYRAKKPYRLPVP